VADDIVTSGGQAARRDEALESLFRARYPQLAAAAFGLAGDWAVAGDLAQEAFARLSRRRRQLGDQDAAAAYLHRTVTSLAQATGRPPGAALPAQSGRSTTSREPSGCRRAATSCASIRPACLADAGLATGAAG
jgi:hypothetical protein